MKAYRHLVKHALKHGYAVSVWDGEEWQLKRSKGFESIVDAIQSVEEAEIRIRNTDDEIVGWAKVSAYGLEDDETVIDHTVNSFMDSWQESYDSTMV